MRTLDERVEGYDLRPPRSEVMAEVEAVSQRDSVPTVHWERGAFWPPRAARSTLPILSGPFDLLFVDAAKGQYREYIELAEPLLTERTVLVIDNLLVGGEVALTEGADRGRSRLRRAALAAFRSLRPQPGRP
jgi:hypothetical protein